MKQKKKKKAKDNIGFEREILENLDKINIPVNTLSVNDIQYGVEQTEDLNEKMEEAEIGRFEADTILRTSLARVFTVIIAFWLLGVLCILTGNYTKYHLSDAVLDKLLTTTTINVLGMMLIILHDLFPGWKRNKKSPTN